MQLKLSAHFTASMRKITRRFLDLPSFPSGFLILSFVTLLGIPQLAQAAELATELVSDQPELSDAVAQIDPSANAGMGWKWRPSDGRRDYGQSFVVDRQITVNTLALQSLFSDPFRANKSVPFELRFIRTVAPDVLGEIEIFASFKGTFPTNIGTPTNQASWLVMGFPDTTFEPGYTYGFLLSFASEGGEERLIIWKVGTATKGSLGGTGLLSQDGLKIAKALSLNFVLGHGESLLTESADRPPRTFVVDQRATNGLRSINQAVRGAKPGDTIELAPGSGPYREALYIPQSGQPGKPIIFDGKGETITGFEPLVFEQSGGEWVCDLKQFLAGLSHVQGFTKEYGCWTNAAAPTAFPSVLTHHGKRIRQHVLTGEFTDSVKLSVDGHRLTLLPGVDPTGWEISARDAVVIILDASHHIYRNIKATGSLNDGFNLHGKGTDLIFENIEGSQNLDEGFSAHDAIDCRIDHSIFRENDNGIGNVKASIMTARNIELSDNLGWGLWLFDCTGTLENVKSWNNGVAQIALNGTTIATLTNVTFATPSWSSKPWISSQETSGTPRSPAFNKGPAVKLTGTAEEEPLSSFPDSK